MQNISQKFIQLLTQYVALQSISTDISYQVEIDKTVEFLTDYMTTTGAAVTVIPGNQVNPLVVGSYQVNDSLPTVLIYGHYDVQPAGNTDAWSNKKPFELLEKEGRYIGRGVVDNKGQNLIHLYTVSELFQSGELGYNVKFLLEGNEESGNEELPGILDQNKELFKADYILVSDGEIVADYPVMEKTLRGGGNIKFTLTTATSDLHSGIYGGATPSSSTELVKLLDKLFDGNRITVPGFYDDLPEITDEVLQNNQLLASVSNPVTSAGTRSLLPNLSYDFYTHTGLLPTLEITGIQTGYTGIGFANILPAVAEARINIRTVPLQDTAYIMGQVVTFLQENTPEYVDINIEVSDHGDGCALNTDIPFANQISQLLTTSYQKPVLYKNVGGSIPILKDFQEKLNIPVLSVSLGNDDCNMHGVDENFQIDLIDKGLQFSKKLFTKTN